MIDFVIMHGTARKKSGGAIEYTLPKKETRRLMGILKEVESKQPAALLNEDETEIVTIYHVTEKHLDL